MSASPALLARLASLFRSKDGALQAYLEWLEARFDATEPRLRAFLTESGRFQRVREDAERLHQRFPEPTQRPPLFGLPLGVKDIFHVEGFATHAGSQLPEQALAGDQASCVTALREAGALILGKTVTTEFAYFAPGPTRNPHNIGHTPGGSSSGSAAAVAAGLTPLALGTQTIGSINRPAAFCGVTGYKPTYARISAAGVIPLSPSLDHIGYFTLDAASAAWVAPLIVAGWTPDDINVRPLRLAIPVGPYLDKAEPTALEQFEVDCAAMQSAGHEVFELPVLSDFEAIVERHNLILAADAARVHQSWFGSFSERYHVKTSELIRRGEAISNTAYETATLEVEVLKDQLGDTMDDHEIDAWITPSAPGPAPAGLESTGDPAMNLPWTQSGMPSATLPSARSKEGLPLGIQLVARVGRDEQLLAMATQLEPCFSYPVIHGHYEFLDLHES